MVALTGFPDPPSGSLSTGVLLDTGSYLAGIVGARSPGTTTPSPRVSPSEHMREGVVIANRRIIQVNQAFRRIAGYRAEEAIGGTRDCSIQAIQAPISTGAFIVRWHNAANGWVKSGITGEEW